MITSHNRIHIFHIFLSISPQPAALETFNEAINTFNLFFFLHILRMLLLRASRVDGRSIHIPHPHPLNRFLFRTHFKSLRSSPISILISSALARQWSFAWALVFFIFSFFRLHFFHFFCWRVNGRPLAKERKSWRRVLISRTSDLTRQILTN